MQRTFALVALVALLHGTVSADVEVFALREIDARLAPIAAHASNYPPHFESLQQRAAAVDELRELLILLKRARDAYPSDRDLNSRLALANALGHNLEMPGCAEAAIEAYENLVRSNPNDGRSEYLYGGFLAGTTLYPQSVPHLLNAIRLGVSDAHYTLAFVYIKLRQPEKALPEFRAYLRVHPENETAAKMARRLESGASNLEIKTLPLQESSQSQR